jgi:protein-tyrosine-phosphatase
MAEAIFKQLNNIHEVRSAGTKVVSPTTGESRHGQLLKDTKGAEDVISVLQGKGIEVRENSRTQLQPELIDWADKVICMAEEETIPDYLKNSPKAIFWKIVDPKGTAYEAHVVILEQIEGLVKEFIVSNNL